MYFISIPFLSSDLSSVKLQRQQDLQVDSQLCNIGDIAAVSPTEMLVCEYGQSTVNLVNSTAGGVTASVSVPGGPRKICLLSGMAAVALSATKIKFIKLGRASLTLDRVLEVDKVICGITTLDSCLVISSTDPPGVTMMSKEGKVMYTVDNQKAGREIFKEPYFLTSSVDGLIYVSDRATNTVTKLDNKLNVLKTFTDPSLQNIQGIISISRDQLLVCIQDNHRIVLLNTRTGNTTVLLGEQDGLKKPFALTYCHTQRKLFVVSCNVTKHIQVYKLV